ncbi:MAG: hypothetical protein GX540_07625 [Clostridiales bacterium]|nr:hypothetical protein [Clostridiales bacterium]
MKKTPKFCALALAAALLFLPMAAHALLVNLGRLSLQAPASFDVFTRDMRPDDPILALYGTSREAVAQELASQGLLMKAREIAGAYTLTLSVAPEAGPDFSALSDEELLSQAQAYSGLGSPDTSPLFRSRQAAFVLLRGGSSLHYLTRVGGSLYRLSLQADGGLNNAMADSLKTIAQSMDFGLGQ